MNLSDITTYIFILIGCGILLFTGQPSFFPEETFFASVCVLVFYNLIEIYKLNKREGGGKPTLASPVVVGAVYMFIANFGVTNLGFIIYDDFDKFWGWGVVDSSVRMSWSSNVTILALVSSLGMWVGYRSGISRYLVSKVERSNIVSSLIRRKFKPRWKVVFCLFALGITGYVYALSLGTLGVFIEKSKWALPILQYIKYLSLGSYVAIIITSIQWVRTRSLSTLILLSVFVISVAFFGFLSGMKSQLVKPFLVAAITIYICKKEIPRQSILLVTVVVFVAFAVIGPVRQSIQSGASIDRVIQGYYKFDRVTEMSRSNQPVAKSVLLRLNVTTRANSLMGYTSKEESSEVAQIPYIARSLLAPVYAVVPRIVWPSKPNFNNGGIAYKELTGMRGNSMSTSPFLPLYWSGGFVACFLGFFVVGICQSVTYSLLYGFGTGGMIVYFALLMVVSSVSGSYYPFIVEFIRYVFLGAIAQYMVLKN